MGNRMESPKKFDEVRSLRDNDKLRLALKLKGYEHISDFASDVGFDRSFISKIIHGHIKPTVDQASKISSKLELSIWDIFKPEDIRDLPKLKGEQQEKEDNCHNHDN